MNRFLCAAAALLLAAGLATSATARVGTGVAVQMEPTDTGAIAGQRYEGSLQLLAHREMELTDFVIEGDDWLGLTWTPVVPAWVDPEGPLRVEFSGTPRVADAPLRVIATADGHTVHRTFALGGAAFERSRSPLSAKQADRPVPPPRGRIMASPKPSGPEVRIDDAPAPEKDRLSYDIRVRGRLIYVRDETTPLGADGLTVNVCDKDLLIDDVLGATVTDNEGAFDITVHWDSQIGETYPDLCVKFRTENDDVMVKNYILTTPYVLEVGPWDNYQGTELDIGPVVPVEEEDQAIFHLMTNYTRFWRYVHNHGHGINFLRVNFPTSEDDGAYYLRATNSIQLPRNSQWTDGTQAHEFGHHLNHSLAEMPEIDYCNEVCDPDFPSDCGHCRWCEEDEDIAWTEGWAQYIAHVIPPTFDILYGITAIGTREFEDLHPCQEDTLWDDASTTEGFTGAVLVDIDDTSYDNDPHTPAFDDRMFLGGQPILDILADHGAMNTMEFLADVLAEYPGENENLWWTAMNNGFNIDTEPPDMVFPIVCGTHLAGVPSANPNVTFHWQRPDDDASGVLGYSVAMFEGAPASPIGAHWIGDVITYTFNDLEPGTYYFCIQPADNDGNRSVDYTSSGPYIITEAQPLNLAFELQTGWDFYVLPRGADDTEPENCTLPDTLDGAAPTFWNLFARNQGDLSTGADMIASVQVDGVEKDRVNGGDIGGGLSFLAMNQGPITVLGGLHTFAGCLDPDGLIDETDESDNSIGLQFSWKAPLVHANMVYYNATPVPDPTGGWDSVSAPFKIFNCFGASFYSSDWWNALVVWSDDPEADYDLRLHDRNANSTGGYATVREASGMPAGWIDAVLVNRNNTGDLPWDAGIVNHNGDTASLKYQHATSEIVAIGDSLTEVMGLNEYVLLREFEIEFIENSDLSLDLWTDPPQADVMFSWFDSPFATGDMLEADASALTGPDGHAHLEVSAVAEAFTCMMISRRPADGDEDLQVTYRIRPTLPDLAPIHLAGWHAPVVPRPDEYATAELVEQPTHLESETYPTWFNFAVQNTSTGTALGAMTFHVGLDGGLGPLSYAHMFDIPGEENRTFINQGPYIVRGGRHTVTLDIDANNYLLERDDGNNTYGEQYVWSPKWLFGGPITRPAPPDRIGGWEHIASGNPAFFNCDGLRSMYTSAFWCAFAVMSGPASDVDVRLHELTSGTQDGFGVNLAHSAWGPGQSDYVLYNGVLAGFMPYDAGVLRIAGEEDYTAEDVMENWMTHGETVHGPVTMAAGRIVDIYETRLTTGNWRVRLENTDGNVDWGLTFHPGDLAFMTKTDALQDASSWFAGPGADEKVLVSITEETYYAIAVWKVGAADLPEEGSYLLHVEQASPNPVAEEELPTVTRVAGVYPNPFNPQTTVEFELAKPAPVDLAVYDLTGRRVATLVRDALPAGKHREVWRGCDDSGRRAASGMYVVRLRADAVTDLKKVMLLK